MDIASGWFGARQPQAALQLRAARELGFDGVALLPGDPTLRLDGLEAARREAQAAFTAASWDGLAAAPRGFAEPGMARTAPARFEGALAAIPAVLDTLRALGCRLLILPVGSDETPGARERGERIVARLRAGEPAGPGDEALEELLRAPPGPRERQLESQVRFLRALLCQAPGLRVALAPAPSPAGLLTPGTLALLLEDRALAGVGYWHDPVVAELRRALHLDEPGQWLDRFGRWILGASLHDYAEGRDRLPPGEGQVDWRLVAEYLPRAARRVLALAPSYPVEILRGARTACAGLGIR